MATTEEKKAVAHALRGTQSGCVVELGARGGEDEAWIREAANPFAPELVRYVMVEPDMRNAQHILRDSGKPVQTSRRRLVLGAISDVDGTATFYGAVNPDGSRTSGSIRRPTGHIIHLPHVKFPEELQTTVPCFSLDTVFREERLDHVDLLWVDIQGAEKNMIAGGQLALQRSRFLFIEAEDVELYEGQALKPELLSLLPGWKLIADFGYNLLLKNESPIEGRI